MINISESPSVSTTPPSNPSVSNSKTSPTTPQKHPSFLSNVLPPMIFSIFHEYGRCRKRSYRIYRNDGVDEGGGGGAPLPPGGGGCPLPLGGGGCPLPPGG